MLDPRQMAGRLTPALAFLAWLVTLCWLLISGTYTAFLAPGLWGLLVLAIVAMLAFAVVRIVRPAGLRHGEAGHSHGVAESGSVVRPALLVLPLAFVFLMPSPQAGSFAFDNRSGMGAGRWNVELPPDKSAGQPGQSPPSTTGPERLAKPPDPRPAATAANLLEIHSDFRSLLGQRVATIGMINPRPGLPNDTVVVFRFSLVCCAADARPVWVLATGKKAQSFKRDTWVRVEGTLGFCKVNGGLEPWINADRIEPTAPAYPAYLN